MAASQEEASSSSGREADPESQLARAIRLSQEDVSEKAGGNVDDELQQVIGKASGQGYSRRGN